MAQVGAHLLFITLVGVVVLAAVLWPRLWRLHELQRENDKLQHEHDWLVIENHERARRILEQWMPR